MSPKRPRRRKSSKAPLIVVLLLLVLAGVALLSSMKQKKRGAVHPMNVEDIRKPESADSSEPEAPRKSLPSGEPDPMNVVEEIPQPESADSGKPEAPRKLLPFGEPDQEVDLAQTAHESWRLKGLPGFQKPDGEELPGLKEDREMALKALLDLSRGLSPDDMDRIKRVMYGRWLNHGRDRIGWDPKIYEENKYQFNCWCSDAYSLCHAFEIDPRKEYLDWLVTYSDILCSRKAYAEDNLIDYTSKARITCWPRAHVLINNAQDRYASDLGSKYRELAKIRESNPEEYRKKKEYYEANSEFFIVGMMSGYMAFAVLRTAEQIYRHPELHDRQVPDFGLPLRRGKGKTYRARADEFFQAGLSALNFFSTNPHYWDEERGTYLSPRDAYLWYQKSEEDRRNILRRIKPWNRTFAIIRAQAQAVRLMKGIDAEKYSENIERFRSQIDRCLRFWVNNQYKETTLRGTSGRWHYGFNEGGKPIERGEDIAHGTATLTLAAQTINFYETNGMSGKDMRAVAVNLLDASFRPEIKEFGHNVGHGDGSGSGLGMLIRALHLAAFHEEFLPILHDAMISRNINAHNLSVENWTDLLYAHEAYRKAFGGKQQASADTSSSDKRAPLVTDVPKKLSVPLKLTNAELGRIKAVDPEGGKITYCLTNGNFGNTFAVDRETGAISVRNPGELDRDKRAIYQLELTASNGIYPGNRTRAIVDIAIEQPAPQLKKGLLAHYGFDKMPGNNEIKDGSSNGNDAVLVARDRSKTFVSGGRNGGAFHGKHGRLELPGEVVGAVRKSNSFTISFWAKNWTPSYSPLVKGISNDNKGIFSLTHWPKGKNKTGNLIWDAGTHSPGKGFDRLLHPVPSPSGAGWRHWIVSKDARSGKMIFFVDGSELAFKNGARRPINKVQSIQLGGADVIMDDIRIYDRSLRFSEIKALYQETRGND